MKEYLLLKHIKPSHFEKDCGFCNGFINSIRKGIGPERCVIIKEKCPDLNMDWLLYGEGEMLIREKPIPSPQEEENTILVKMYEDMHRKDAETILDLQKRLFIAEHRCQLLQSQLDNKLA